MFHIASSATPTFAPVGRSIRPADHVDVHQFRTVIGQAHPLLDYKLMPGMKSVCCGDRNIVLPMGVPDTALLDPAARPHSVTAAATTAAANRSRPH
jgi:hypothetical protein